MAYIQPVGNKRRLMITLPAPNGVVVSLDAFIKAGLTAAKADLFNNDDLQLTTFLTSLQGWRVEDGFLEHATTGSSENFYIMTNFLGRDSGSNLIFPYTGSNMTTYGIEVSPTVSRHYLGDIFLKDVLIYCADNTIDIALDLMIQR